MQHTWVTAILLALFQLTTTTMFCQSGKAEWLNALRNEIGKVSHYDKGKTRTIADLHSQATKKGERDQFNHLLKIQEAFAVYKFDSAYFYARKLKDAAGADLLLAKKAELKICAVLLSAGMFKEVFDTLAHFDPQGLPDSVQTSYYILKARSYADLSEYNQAGIFADTYHTQADIYIDSCIGSSPERSFTRLYYKGLKSIRGGDIRNAGQFFNQLVKDPQLTLHEQAVAYSTFSDIYIRRGMTDSAIILLAKASIADIRSSTKETTAILHLAALLFKLGDLENASFFIQKAASDAKSFGAKQRMVQLGNILPVIEAERFASVERDKQNITLYAVIITLLFLMLIALSFIIARQVRKLNLQQKIINDSNAALQHLVEEKEWLLKEVHHRVKNNLHTINSLLESQSAYLKNDALKAIRDTQHRVFAMSLIHQKLYQPENKSTGIEISVYMLELIRNLQESYENGQRVIIQTNLDSLMLDISQAVPIGLILNEAVTNALKYAFPMQRRGEINIRLTKSENNHFILEIADNGIGLPPQFDSGNNQSLGLKLMKGLSEELSAQFSIENRKGTRIIIDQTKFR